MMRRIVAKKAQAVLLCILLIICTFAVVWLSDMFLVGKVISPGSIGLIEAEAFPNQVNVKGDFILESARAYKNYKVRTDGENMYITIYGVIVSSFYRYGVFDITIDGDFSDIKNIYLEGNGETELIYGADGK